MIQNRIYIMMLALLAVVAAGPVALKQHHHHHPHHHQSCRERKAENKQNRSPEEMPKALAAPPSQAENHSGSLTPLSTTTSFPSISQSEISNLKSYVIPGLGARKRQILNAGANSLQLAVAMLETEHMQPTPFADHKTGDSANWGIFNQNWYMLRTTQTQFHGKLASDWQQGVVLNNDLARDIQAFKSSMNSVGIDQWFAGQRNGQTGLQNHVVTPDIANYHNAILKIQLWLESGHLDDDLRLLISVVHI